MLEQAWLFPPDTDVSGPDMRSSPPHRAKPAKRAVGAPGANGGAGLRLCVLGSGSGGNSSVLRLGDQAILVDAGFGPVRTARALRMCKLEMGSIRALCLTHLDHDHFRPHWLRTLLGWNVPVYLHRWYGEQFDRIEGAPAMRAAGLVRHFDGQPFEPIDGLAAQPIHLAHDRKGTTGFRFDSPLGRVGYATDLGHVPDELVERFIGVDVLAIESNYDPAMQLNSSRPAFLKNRIMGGQGHLSNEQSFEAVKRIVDRGAPHAPQHVVLLHRSRQCNTPERVRKVFSRDPRISKRLTLTDQRRRTRWLAVRSARRPDGAQFHLPFGQVSST